MIAPSSRSVVVALLLASLVGTVQSQTPEPVNVKVAGTDADASMPTNAKAEAPVALKDNDADLAARKAHREHVKELTRKAMAPNEDDAKHEHDNGTAIERYEFHSEMVFTDKKRGPNIVTIYRTSEHDKKTRGLPSCAAVDGWYLSLNGLPFWPVENLPTGLPAFAARCDFALKDWPEGKQIRDEVPREMDDMVVVFAKEKPPDELYWKSEL